MHFTHETKVTSYDCDVRNHMRISAAMRYMQETAGLHLVSLGCPAEVLMEEDLVFLMSKMSLKIHRIPVLHEEIIVGTAPTSTKGVRFVREFIVDTRDGERLISGVSHWPLVRPASRKVLRPKDFTRSLPFQPETVSKYIEDIPFPKIDIQAEELYKEEIKYSDIDINNHVNNAVYGDIICDAIPYDLMTGSELNTVAIEFKNEAVLDDTISIKRQAVSEKEFLITGSHERAECFRGLVTFL